MGCCDLISRAKDLKRTVKMPQQKEVVIGVDRHVPDLSNRRFFGIIGEQETTTRGASPKVCAPDPANTLIIPSGVIL